MAIRDTKRRTDEAESPRWKHELTGLVCLALGVLLLLSLVRYSPADLPQWWWLKRFAGPAGMNGENLLGPLGGMLAFVQFQLFGAAAFLLPVGLVWCAIYQLAFNGRIWPRVLIGMALLLVSGAAWLEASNYLLVEWARGCLLPGPGGWIGRGLGGVLLTKLLSQVGTLLVTGLVYVVAMILLAGQSPLPFTKACGRAAWAAFLRWRQRCSETGLQEARDAEREAERERQRQQRRKERDQVRAASADIDETSDAQALLPLRDTPVPQIFDASQRRLTQAVVPGAKPFERKKPTHQSPSGSGFDHYELPGYDLLDPEESGETPQANHDELMATQNKIVETLKAFAIDVTPGDITRGPSITRYEIYPSTGLRVSRISQLEADLARATCAERINILAPIPGKDTVGIEIANSKRVAVPLHELLHDTEFASAKKKIPLALGKDVYGKTVIGDLAAMPHLLVAGATGSGKSVCINSIIASMLFKFGPDELRFIMVDPKVVEMQMYNRLPHLVVPVVTDPKKTVAALKWVVNEMEKRYRIFAREGVRNFDGFNNRQRKPKPLPVETPDLFESPTKSADEGDTVPAALDPNVPASHQAPPWSLDDVEDEQLDSIAAALASGELGPESDDEDDEFEALVEESIPDRFPYIVVLIDELADLMQTAPADVEMCIARIAQKARAAGIHLIIATQTPRADVVTGIIKANIPCRIAFQVSSQLDSRVILDTKGAEKLVGKGDMLYLPPGSAKLERSQGAFVTDAEIERIIDHCAAQASPHFETDIHASLDQSDADQDDDVSDADEELIMKCIEVVRQERKASTSLLQRRLRLGYTRAARMVDILEQRGIVGPGDGAKAREVFLK